MRSRWRFGVLTFLLALGVAAAGEPPQPVSPRSAQGVARVAGPCPTFSWGGIAEADSYELVIFRLPQENQVLAPEPERRPVLRTELPGTATSWTPSLGRCLEPGGRYAWSLRGTGIERAGEWSAPALFEVVARPSTAELEQALLVVQRYLDTEAGATAAAGGQTPPIVRGPERERGTPAGERGPAPVPPIDAALSVDDNLRVTVGNTPTLRLEQDDSGGFAPQVWDIGANEVNLFVADRTAGTTTLPFKILAGAPDDSLRILADGTALFGGGVAATSFSGGGSGLFGVNASLLENLGSSAFLRSNTSDTFSGGTLSIGGTLDITNNLDLPTGIDKITGGGSGTGLDADKVDGQHASGFYLKSQVDTILADHRMEDHSKLIFVTSTLYNGDLGDLSGADQKCMTRAAAGGLSGTFQAWLSGHFTTTEARDRLRLGFEGPYVMPNGEKVADSWDDFTDGSLDSAIDRTETGSLATTIFFVWTNTTTIGSRAFQGGACTTLGNEWSVSDSSEVGRYGLLNQTNGNWTNANQNLTCNNLARLYCIEQ